MPNHLKYKLGALSRLTMGRKLTLAVSAIVTMLVLSSIISIVEFRRMSNQVSSRIEDNITAINNSTTFIRTIDKYNLHILSIVGEADSITVSNFNPTPYLQVTDGILNAFCEKKSLLADSLKLNYDAYIATSKQLDSVIVSDFVDTRDWYFTVLQPRYSDLRNITKNFNEKIYQELEENSVSFDDSFYRSVTPGTVSAFAGIILILLLLFFIMVYYVRPLRKMLTGLDNYKHFGQPYRNVFEGNDELQALNGDISDIIEENLNLKKRLRDREH